MRTFPLILTAGVLLTGCGDKENQAPEFSSSASTVSLTEGSTSTGLTASAEDPDGDVLTYSLAGPDADLFTIASNGSLSFLLTPDFEAPEDANQDNQFELTIIAQDSDGNTANQSVTIELLNEDEPLVQLSANTVELPELSEATFYSAQATDPDGSEISYVISGGEDAALFSILVTGELAATNALDFESPADSNSDGLYNIEITASNTTESLSWPVAISVTDVATAFSSAEVSAGSEPHRLLLNWALNEEPTGAAEFRISADLTGSGTFIERSRAGLAAGSIELDYPLLTTNLDTLELRVDLVDATDALLADSGPLAPAANLQLADLVGYFKSANPAASEGLGKTLAMSQDGETLAIGVPNAKRAEDPVGSSGPGAVLVFTQTNGGWSQTAELRASNADVGDQFGSAIDLSLDGRWLIVGAPFEDGSGSGVATAPPTGPDLSVDDDTGAAYLFQLDSEDTWVEEAYLKPFGGNPGEFGTAVAIGGFARAFAVSAPSENNLDGAVYTYRRLGSINTSQRLTHPDALPGGLFGSSLDLDKISEYLVVGAPRANQTGQSAVFKRSSARDAGLIAPLRAAPADWQSIALLSAPNGVADDEFGHAVAINHAGDTIIASAPEADSGMGSTYVFERGTDWTFSQELQPANGRADDLWGGSIALSPDGNTLAIGSAREDSSAIGELFTVDAAATNSGAAVLYSRTTMGFTEGRTLKASNTGRDDAFGSAVALNNDGTQLAVGAPNEDGSTPGISVGAGEDDSEFNSGAVYLY